MKTVILAGGQQSTINNETVGIPKPMVEIGGKPLLWHIMKGYSQHGCKEFIICGGYKVEVIKEYFMDYYIYESDITVDLQENTIKIHNKKTEDWKVTVVDTGMDTATGARIQKIQQYTDGDDFLVTFGDCLSDLNIHELIVTHKQQEHMVTAAIAKPTGRKRLLPFNAEGELKLQKSNEQEEAWVSAGCFVFQKKIFEHLQDHFDIEKYVFENLSDHGDVAVYTHKGFWTTIETMRDKVQVESLWNAGIAPWIDKQ